MKKIFLIITILLTVLILILILILLSSRGSFLSRADASATSAASTATALVAAYTDTPVPPTATSTPTITLTPTVTITATPTLEVALAVFDFVYGKSSLFSFDLSYSSGEYYGTGRIQDGTLLNYNCWFKPEQLNRLVCTGGSVPFDTRVNFQLFRKDTSEMIYEGSFLNNTLTHGEIIPSPTGVSCEVEPQWGGSIPEHQLGTGCFAMSCWQNGVFFYGTDNTCADPWPFLWNFTHPLNVPYD